MRLVIAALALLLAGRVRAADPPVPFVQYTGDRLTVRVTGMPLDQLLADVARQAGAEIRGGLRAPRDVTAEFEAVPLPDALHRLLGDQNFALVYGEAGQLRAVKLLGGPLGPSHGLGVLATTGGPPTTVPVKAYDTAGTLLNLIVTHAPISLTGRLATALGETATVQQVIETGLHHDDPALRSDAIRRTLALLEAEPELRAAVVSAAKGMDDGDLASLLKSASPGHAEEVAVHVATQARVTELRVKASSILQQIRAGKTGG